MTKTDLKKRIKEIQKMLANIEEKIGQKINEDIDAYEVQSDLGRRRVDKMKLKELLEAKNEYRNELTILEDRLKQMLGHGAKNILMRFDRN